LAFFDQTTDSSCKNCDHNIVFFLEKRQFFRRKLGKIAENCDHNIDPYPVTLAEAKELIGERIGPKVKWKQKL
jgi:hypothetical protein